ncbi:MAG: AAA-like domain-containing protein [Cyanobacteria bacterium P01_F01_bin.143]
MKISWVCQQDLVLDLDTDVVDWWQERSQIGFTQRLNQFFQEVLLTEITEPIVIFIDEIDTTLSLDFTDDLYAAIRYLYLSRSLKPELRRLSFVLVGVATPSDLIRDPKRTPFNIGERVDLTDFTFEEALPFAQGLELEAEKSWQVLQWVLHWTGGHPYLTQRLFQRLIEQEHQDWSQAAVDKVVKHSFFGDKSERDSNLQFVRDMLTKRSPDLSEGLLTYRAVRRGHKTVLDEEQSLVKSHLKLSGVVLREKGRLQVRNRIYRQVFNEDWVRKHLPINWKKRLQKLGIGLGILFLLAPTPAAIFSYRQYQKAEAARQEAVKQKDIAEKERQEAERQRGLAEAAQQEAEKQREFAESRTVVAMKARQKELEQKKIAQKKREEAEAAKQEAEDQREIAEEQKLEAIAAQQEAKLAQEREAKARLEAEAQRKIAAQGRDEAQIVTLITSAERRFDSSPGIAAVIEALKAGKELQDLEAKLKQSDTESKVDSATKMRIVTALRQIVYDALEHNRLEHDTAVRTVSISPDERIVASAGDDGIIKLWNPDGSLKNTIKAHQLVNYCIRKNDIAFLKLARYKIIS